MGKDLTNLRHLISRPSSPGRWKRLPITSGSLTYEISNTDPRGPDLVDLITDGGKDVGVRPSVRNHSVTALGLSDVSSPGFS